jgi:hypothetical protein
VIGVRGLSLKAIITQNEVQPKERQEITVAIPSEQCRILANRGS